ncbi:MAG: DUF1697 domain-containing protein [Isosphaerales bacterium]
MPRFIAFLRAINVGGRTVKMDFLRKAFEPLGFSNVETFIASGNVIFESRATTAQRLEKKIESQLQESLGYEVRIFIRSASELANIAQCRPFMTSELEADYHALYIAFLPAQPSGEAEQKLMSFRTEDDDFHIQGREVYWLCRKKFSESAFNGAMLEKLLGMAATLRNATTVRKLSAKYPD